MLESYDERERDDGSGNRRIGEPLQFGENMYSMAYVSMVKEMYKTHCDKLENDDAKHMKEVFVKVLGADPEA